MRLGPWKNRLTDGSSSKNTNPSLSPLLCLFCEGAFDCLRPLLLRNKAVNPNEKKRSIMNELMQPLCSDHVKHLQHLTMEFRMSAHISQNELTGWSRGCQFYPLWYNVGCIPRHLYLHTIKYTHIYISNYYFNYLCLLKCLTKAFLSISL